MLWRCVGACLSRVGRCGRGGGQGYFPVSARPCGRGGLASGLVWARFRGPAWDPGGTRAGPGRDPGGIRGGPGRDPGGTRSGPGRDPGPHGSCTGSRRHPKGTLHAAGVARGHFSTLGVAHRRSARNAGGPERGAGPFQRAYLRLQRCPDPGTAARGDAGAGSRPGPAPPVRDRKGGALHASRAVSEPRKGTRTAQSPSLCPRRPAQPPRAPHGHRTAP
jgi:hypothetical protein